MLHRLDTVVPRNPPLSKNCSRTSTKHKKWSPMSGDALLKQGQVVILTPKYKQLNAMDTNGHNTIHPSANSEPSESDAAAALHTLTQAAYPPAGPCFPRRLRAQ
jgi:hypothetical protein